MSEAKSPFFSPPREISSLKKREKFERRVRIHYAPFNLADDFPPIGRGQSALFKYSAASSRGPIKTHFVDWVIKLQSTA